MKNDDFTPASTRGLTNALSEMRSLASGFSGDLTEAAGAMRLMDGQAAKLSRSLSSTLRGAFDKAVFGGAKLSDVFRDLASSIAGRTLNAALQPVTNAISGGFGKLIGGATGSLFGFADGGVFSNGRQRISGPVRAFASGGIVNGPTTFPMRGATGLMGEAGPEAIMPLSRGADGKLGVAAQGRRNASSIVVNITTPDVAGFQQSRGQISAQLARAVRRGQGNL